MGISYAGVDLLLPTEEIMQRIDHYLNFDDAVITCPRAYPRTHQHHSRSYAPAGRGFATPNYPLRPRKRINSLYWPTGATRWAEGYFLATQAQLQQIMTTIQGDESSPQELVLEDGTGSVLRTDMFLLSPRPFTPFELATSEDGPQVLWLLPLVDERYYWQFRTLDMEMFSWIDVVGIVGGASPAAMVTWDEMFGVLEEALQSPINRGEIEAAYLNPDLMEMGRQFADPATMLDVAAHSVGCRVVRNFDGEVRVIGFSDSEQLVADNFTGDSFGIITHGDGYDKANFLGSTGMVGDWPRHVQVIFRKYRDGVIDLLGEEYMVENNEEDTEETGINGATHVIYSSALADFTDVADEESDPPNNESDLIDLAAAIAGDYRLSCQGFQIDTAFAGVKSYSFGAWDDHLLIEIGSLGPTGAYRAQTRAQSLPANFGMCELLHCFEDLPVFQPNLIAKLAGDITEGGDAIAHVMAGEDETNFEIKVFDDLEIAPADEDMLIEVRFDPYARHHVLIQHKCSESA